MAINVFEGARRVSYLVMGLWCVGVAIYLFTDTPRVDVSYVVRGPTEPFTHSVESDCAFADKSESRHYTTANGTSVRAAFCFRAVAFKDGKMRVPYRVDDKGLIWGHESWSSEVSEYAKRRVNDFTFSASEEKRADDLYWPTRFRQLKEVVLWLVGGLVAIWFTTFVTGWIVRGFAGIPMGRDQKVSGP
jgi:hypothetical protein